MADKEVPQKKVLSLVLCVAVMLSVMVMGAGAAFSDQDKIENTEAVDACCCAEHHRRVSRMGLIIPNETLSGPRSCKMICVALNGGKEPTLGSNCHPHVLRRAATPQRCLGGEVH